NKNLYKDMVKILKKSRIVKGWDQAKCQINLESKIADKDRNPNLELIADLYKGTKIRYSTSITDKVRILDAPDVVNPREILNHIKEQYAKLYAANGMDWSTIEKLTEAMNFDSNFIRIIQRLFKEQKAYIMDTSMLPEPSRISKEVQQANPISSLLSKITAYADDLTIGIALQAEWSTLNSLIISYEAVSNTKINESKSVLVPLSMNARCFEGKETKKFKTIKENESITILSTDLIRRINWKVAGKNLDCKVTYHIKNLSRNIQAGDVTWRFEGTSAKRYVRCEAPPNLVKIM
ncbi:22939_t:CDS:2, partial [Gigaspora rosea]